MPFKLDFLTLYNRIILYKWQDLDTQKQKIQITHMTLSKCIQASIAVKNQYQMTFQGAECWIEACMQGLRFEPDGWGLALTY